MATEITALNVTEDYSALTILTQAQLNTAVAGTEDYCNTELRLNLIQLAIDIFPDASYVFNDDGVQTQASPLSELVALLADNETIEGTWTFNGDVVQNGNVTGSGVYSSSGQPRCRVYIPTSAQSLATATATALSFGAESYDVGSMHDNSTNPDRVTIQAGGSGIYSFIAQATFAADNTGRRELLIYKNGSKVAEVKEFNPDGTEETVLQCNYQDTATAGDYYQVFAYQDSGGNLDIENDVTWFSTMKVW